jgi:signal transduction histidine kinase
LKQLALVAELARPLAHECNNFLNNLLLQLAISEKSFPESSRAEWANIRREGKKLASLFQQWQRQHKPSAEKPTKIELHELMQALVDEARAESAVPEYLVRPGEEPLFLEGRKPEVQHLFSLLLRYAAAAQRSNGPDRERIEIELAKDGTRALTRLHYAGAQWADFDEVASSDRATLSLRALACKALVERLGGNIRMEADPNRGAVLIVDLARIVP